MHFHVVWFVADTVHDMEFDELFAPAYEEGKRLICIETDRGSCLRNETLKVLERTDFCWNRYLTPPRNLGPDEERYTGLETFGHLDRTVRFDPCKRRSAIRDRYFTPKLLDGADAIEMQSARQGFQIQHRRELSIHYCLALTTDEPKVIPDTLHDGRAVGQGLVSESTNPEPACGTTTYSQTHLENVTARNHGFPPDCPTHRTWSS